jgi:lysozyme
MTIGTIEDLIEQHEGRKLIVYDDATGRPLVPGSKVVGNPTFGVGHNGQKPLSTAAVNQIKTDDIADATAECVAIFGDAWPTFTAPRQAAFIDMAFELGENGLAKFEHMVAAAQVGQWQNVAAEALASAWAAQVPERAKTDAAMLLSGEWP